MAADLYPPSPASVPADLTKPSRSYKTRVVIVLGSLFVFVALYIALIVGSAYFSYWSFSQMGAASRPTRTYSYGRSYREKDNSGWWLVPGICSALLCLFLVKGFFKRQRV